MDRTRVASRLWLSIVSFNVVNLSSLIFSIKHRLGPAIDSFVDDSQDVFAQSIATSEKKSQNKRNESSQLDRVRKKNLIKIAIMGDKAYWVHNNVFYESDIHDGVIDNHNARPIDAYRLSEKELKNLLDILDSMNS